MKKFAAFVMLLLTTFFWGLTFTIVKDAVARVDVFVFLAQRFVIAFLLLVVISLLRGGRLKSATLRHGTAMGVFLFPPTPFRPWRSSIPPPPIPAFSPG